MARVYVSIGSNVDREHNVVSCLEYLKKAYGELMVSTIYESKSVGFDGNNFYNLVAGFDTDDDVYIVADTLHDIENRHGRDRNSKRFAPRTLDIDLLLYDDLVLHGDGIEIPRDDLVQYVFVLKPLVEIDPDYMHPVLHRTVAEILNESELELADIWPITL
ncbi:MAG: 2-amino-4-hydroxy-6-hydroxymethyldihydropteridine diphosphokinase [Gammaproteobacteria bacterium]|nr:2-amino-4-hydroxy-6-hydroxymethyldihydropteridine diphosphokinase [Gammaproteobacteria bacterium]